MVLEDFDTELADILMIFVSWLCSFLFFLFFLFHFCSLQLLYSWFCLFLLFVYFFKPDNLNSSSIEAAALLYSSFILDEPSSTPYSGYVHDDSRFVWNFLDDRTSIPKENTSSVCSHNCDDKSEVCITVETGKGTCIISTTSLPGTATCIVEHMAYLDIASKLEWKPTANRYCLFWAFLLDFPSRFLKHVC